MNYMKWTGRVNAASKTLAKGGIGSIITVYHLCNIDLCYPQVVQLV